MLERWTRAVLRFRVAVLACWLAVVVLGALAAAGLPPLLSNSFAVPGSESDRAREILAAHFGERPDGVFTVVFTTPRSRDKAEQARLQRRLARAARIVPTGKAGDVHDGAGVVYGDVSTTLDLQHAKRWTEPLRRALRGTPRAYVTGQPAIQHDLDPILAADLRRGEAVALPIALLVLIGVLGLSLAVLVPFVFAACTITATLAIVWSLAHGVLMVSYVANLVELIGLGLAVDYSLLVVARFREELEGEGSVDDAVVRTISTAGRAVVFSGAAVAIGLALIVLMPVPFVRSLGVGGFLVPVASIAAALTLQPVLLSLLGRRGMRRIDLLPGTRGFWERLAGSIMRRPVAYLAAGTALLVAAAVPVAWLQLTPGSISAIPQSTESARGLALLRDDVGPGVITPTEIVVDAGAPGAARSPAVRAAVNRLADSLFHDPEVFVTASGKRKPFVDPSGRYARIYAVGRHEYGEPVSRRLVQRIRGTLVPAARFPAGARAYAGGAPPQGVDFLARTYGAFPWLIAGVLVLTYLVLLRAFRSLLLPLKAVLLNVLSVAATYGILVVVFRWGVGADLFGLYHVPQVEGWIPIFLFAMLFGLSMDYEVFLVSRMREAYDELRDTRRAVAYGLERTGRVVTAAAAIMVAAFSGFVAGRVAGLQEFGFGLALAVLLDATIVRALLVPAIMAVLGRWNWWLPRALAERLG